MSKPGDGQYFNVIKKVLKRSSQSKAFVITTGFLIVMALGFIDYQTGPDVSFLLFYLIPVFWVTWFAGSLAGTLLSLASAVFWFFDDVLRRHSIHVHPIVPYWNATVKFMVFLGLIHILATLKDTLVREKHAEEERIRREIEIAREVQMHMLPQELPVMKTLDYAGICKPALGVGGDYYDFLQLAEGRFGIALGDVSGKGLPSALLMASLQGMLRSHAFLRRNHVAELIKKINVLMGRSTSVNRFATFFYGQYDESHRSLTYVNAGHNPPVLLRPSTAFHANTGSCVVTHLNASGPVLGVFEDATYQQRRITLRRGDVLLLFTDGITEAMNLYGEEFGEDRLVSMVMENRTMKAAELENLILNRVDAFSVGTVQHDDLTLVVIKVVS